MRKIILCLVLVSGGMSSSGLAHAAPQKNKVLCITNDRPPVPPTPEICVPYPLP